MSIAVTPDYTIANAAISATYYSYLVNPQGYPGWFNWTPGYTGFSSNPSGASAKFMIVGKQCTVTWVHGTPGTSNATGFTITGLPVTAAHTISGFMNLRVYNNTAFQAGAGLAEISGTTITLSRDGTGATWTASGQKSVFLEHGLTYEF